MIIWNHIIGYGLIFVSIVLMQIVVRSCLRLSLLGFGIGLCFVVCIVGFMFAS